MINLERRVVCAANRYKDNIILGPRHWDVIMHKHAKDIGFTDFSNLGSEWEEGFINTWGEFLTRKEAWEVARENKQILKFVGGQHWFTDDNELYSENLY